MPHFVIMGAGRVGVMLARTLEASGHTVAVIDQDERAFQPLRKGFEGQLVTGVGFDQETLKRAGITEAYAFAAVSSGDNSNIIAARVARELFKVKNVVAVRSQPRRILPAHGHPHGGLGALVYRSGVAPSAARAGAEG